MQRNVTITIVMLIGALGTGLTMASEQMSSARIHGRFSGPSGLDTSAYDIVLLDESSDIVAVADMSEGSYALASVAPGFYRMAVRAPGVPPIHARGGRVFVRGDESLRRDIKILEKGMASADVDSAGTQTGGSGLSTGAKVAIGAAIGLAVVALVVAGNDDDGESGPYCGNGIVEPGEQCDDGNNIPGDGCTGCEITASPSGP